jgi:ATP-dependent DNA ligase
VRLFTRRGVDWTDRYPSIAGAVAALSCHSCLIDGEVVICDDDGIPIFDRLRYGPQTEAVLFAFDLLEAAKTCAVPPLRTASALSLSCFAKAAGRSISTITDEADDIVFRHACKLGFEAIVSKRLGSPYVSGRSPRVVSVCRKSDTDDAIREPKHRGALEKDERRMSYIANRDRSNLFRRVGVLFHDGSYRLWEW